MNLTKSLVVAAVPITAIALAGTAHAAGAVPTDPPPASVPANWVQLVDDTNTIMVSAPPEWTDVNTAPYTTTAGAVVPSIAASSDITVFNETFDVNGVWYTADTYRADTAAVADAWGLTSGCEAETSAPYDDGVFAGTHVTYTGCGGGDAEYHVIAANPADQAFTAAVQVQITGPEFLPILDGIIESFNRVGGSSTTATTPSTAPATAPVVTTPAVPTVPTPTVAGPTTSDPGVTLTLPTVPEIPSDLGVPAGWTVLTDDSQTIGIAVPATWTVVATDPSDDGAPWISATTDAAFFAQDVSRFTVPGVVYMARPFTSDTEALNLAGMGSDANECTDAGAQPYDDGVFVGHIHTWTNCGGTATTIHHIAANPQSQQFTASLLIQLTGQPDDATTFEALKLTFGFAGGSSETATSVPAPATTVPGTPTTMSLGEFDPVTVFQESMQSTGVELTYDQAACWLGSMNTIDSSDPSAVADAATACGVVLP